MERTGMRKKKGWSRGEIPMPSFGWGVRQCLSLKILFWVPFFPCLCSTVELGIWGSELSPKDVIQLAKGEKEGKSHQA